jgi:ABC-2 type transport system ATP-binding protein
MAAHIIIRDLWKHYGPTAAVRGVSLAVERGEIFGLLGPNGAGKTTTLECVLGLREADRGTIEIAGIDARRDRRAAKQRVGVALQETAVQDKITPREALRLFGALYGVRAEPDQLLARFGLTDKADAHCDTLSGGQRQRLGLALALVNRPEVVLLDEPTAGLDPQARRELHDEIRRLKRDACTVLMATHFLEEAEALCDRVAILDRGEVVATGAPRELVGREQDQTVTLVTDQPIGREELAGIGGIRELVVTETTVRFQTRQTAATIGALGRRLAERQIEIVELHVGKASLEEVFLQLTREGRG